MSPISQAPGADVMYAWCFDHGRLHRFLNSGPPWCTAAWVDLPGASEEEALRHKELTWGQAQFFHDLPLDRQGGLIATIDKRERELRLALKSETPES